MAQLADARFRGAFILEIAGDGDLSVVLERAQHARAFLRDLCDGGPRTGKATG
jgi:hypothetical protein